MGLRDKFKNMDIGGKLGGLSDVVRDLWHYPEILEKQCEAGIEKVDELQRYSLRDLCDTDKFKPLELIDMLPRVLKEEFNDATSDYIDDLIRGVDNPGEVNYIDGLINSYTIEVRRILYPNRLEDLKQSYVREYKRKVTAYHIGGAIFKSLVTMIGMYIGVQIVQAFVPEQLDQIVASGFGVAVPYASAKAAVSSTNKIPNKAISKPLSAAVMALGYIGTYYKAIGPVSKLASQIPYLGKAITSVFSASKRYALPIFAMKGVNDATKEPISGEQKGFFDRHPEFYTPALTLLIYAGAYDCIGSLLQNSPIPDFMDPAIQPIQHVSGGIGSYLYANKSEKMPGYLKKFFRWTIPPAVGIFAVQSFGSDITSHSQSVGDFLQGRWGYVIGAVAGISTKFLKHFRSS